MTDLVAGRHATQRFPRTRRVRRLLVWRRARRGRRLGEVDSVSLRAARRVHARSFTRADTFSLGVCNGCQMMSALQQLIPGTEHWPRFVRNRSEQFEGRLSLVEVVKSPSLFFAGMEGSRMPIAVAHGEGRAEFAIAADARGAASVRICCRCASSTTAAGRPNAIRPTPTARRRADGHHDAGRARHAADAASGARLPNRAELLAPDEWGEDSPWMRIFRNARVWVG